MNNLTISVNETRVQFNEGVADSRFLLLTGANFTTSGRKLFRAIIGYRFKFC